METTMFEMNGSLPSQNDTYDYVFLGAVGEGSWCAEMVAKLPGKNAMSSLVRPVLKFLMESKKAPTRNPLKYFNTWGISLRDLVEGGYVPRGKHYVVSQGGQPILNDVTVPMYEYVHETWIPPSVDYPDAIFINSRELQAWLEHFYPRYWYATGHHFYVPPGAVELPRSSRSIREPALLGYAPEDNGKIFGENWERQNTFLKASFRPYRELRDVLLQNREAFLVNDVGMDSGAYFRFMEKLRYLLVLLPSTWHVLSRRILDCAMAGVVPLLDVRGCGAREFYESLKLTEEMVVFWDSIPELLRLVESGLPEKDLGALYDWAQPYRYENIAGEFWNILQNHRKRGFYIDWS